MYRISITNQQRALRVNRSRLVKLAEATLKAEKIRGAEISVALVDDARIHAINRKFLGHDYPTDVISFLLDSAPKGRKPTRAATKRSGANGSTARGAGRFLEGEIIISAETAVQIAAEYDWPPVHELSLYLVHGLLHLCGYDDLTSEQERVMRAREMEVLEPWKFVPHYVA